MFGVPIHLVRCNLGSFFQKNARCAFGFSFPSSYQEVRGQHRVAERLDIEPSRHPVLTAHLLIGTRERKTERASGVFLEKRSQIATDEMNRNPEHLLRTRFPSFQTALLDFPRLPRPYLISATNSAWMWADQGV